MMQVRRQDDRGGLVSSLHLLWEDRRWCDGLVICRDGAVPFASLALASSSPHLARTLASQDTADTVKIIARGFSVLVVRSLMSVLHGGQATFTKPQLSELSQLLRQLGLQLVPGRAQLLAAGEEGGEVARWAGRRQQHSARQFPDWGARTRDGGTHRRPAETLPSQVFQKVTYIKTEDPSSTGREEHPMAENLEDHNYKKSSVVDISQELGSEKNDFQNVIEKTPEPSVEDEGDSVTTVIIDNSDVLQTDVGQHNIIWLPSTEVATQVTHSLTEATSRPKAPIKRPRSSNYPPGEVKSEEEAKVLASPFIGKVESKPPQYRCLHDGCSYSNSRLLMTQSHVYKHLNIYTFQCQLCGLKCRLETNFEKHLNTHGFTRRREKVGPSRYRVYQEASSLGTSPATIPPTQPQQQQIIVLSSETTSGVEAGESIEDIKEFIAENNTKPIVTAAPEEEYVDSPDPCQQYTTLQQYHLNKKSVFMDEAKAEPIIRSYVLKSEVAEVAGVWQCSLCSLRSGSEAEVMEHVSLEHLNIFSQKCGVCSVKTKLRTHLAEHLAQAHGQQLSLATHDPDTAAAEPSSSAAAVEDSYSAAAVANSSSTAAVEDSLGNFGDIDFPFRDHGMEVRVGEGGARRVHVGGAPQPLLRLNRSVLAKLSQGRLVSRAEADKLVSGHAVRNSQTGHYECSLCDGAVRREKLHMMQRHLYEHFNLYFYQCPLCNDIFRYGHQFKDHQESHKKALKRESGVAANAATEDGDTTVGTTESSSNTTIGADKLLKSEYYESLETDFPDSALDLSTLEVAQLKGKKISTKQAKSIKGKYMIFNEKTQMHECQLCNFKREWRGNLQHHVLTHHYDVYLYRCPVPQCGLLLRNWPAFQSHHRSHRHDRDQEDQEEAPAGDGVDYQQLEAPLYAGEQEGLRIARSYTQPEPGGQQGARQCRVCGYRGKGAQVTTHVLAQHLPAVHLYRCQYCSKLFRYSRARWRDHEAAHAGAKVECPQCPQAEAAITYSKESLKAHIRRNHTAGTFECGQRGCEEVFRTRAEARTHERAVHLLGLPGRGVRHVCEWCDYSFPTRSRWKKHVVTCQRGTSRTGFRKQISDVLQWLGRGGYKCNFCGLEFHPEADSVIGTALPEARNHVASLHGMRHMRKAKMQWHGDPKHVKKDDIYKDKSNFWNQKAKDIDKIRSDALQEDKMFTIESEINESIADAAKGHDSTVEAGAASAQSYQIMKLVQDSSGVVRMQQQQHGGQLGPEQVILVQQPGLGLGQGETIVVTSLGGDRVQTEGVVEIENVEFIGIE